MKEKIIAIVRTRDEERNIGRFCEAYQDIADKILVADGGSEDKTIEIASSFPNVEIRNYTKRTQMKGGHWRNNDSDHINYLIAWAMEKEYEANWIILDDCDCVPNYLLRQDCRSILAETESNVVMAVRMYLWGTKEHFSNMSKPGKEHEKYEGALWAWRPKIELFTVDRPPAYTLTLGSHPVNKGLNKATGVEVVMPPYCLLHYSWDDPDITHRKVAVYRDSGLIPTQLHPLDFAGPLKALPEWARLEKSDDLPKEKYDTSVAAKCEDCGIAVLTQKSAEGVIKASGLCCGRELEWK